MTFVKQSNVTRCRDQARVCYRVTFWGLTRACELYSLEGIYPSAVLYVFNPDIPYIRRK